MISIIKGFKKCLYLVPLPVLSLVIYMGLRTTTFFPDGLVSDLNQQPLWQRSFVGWYDFLLGLSVIISFALGSLKLSKPNLIFLWTLGLIIVLSLINGITLSVEVALDALVCLVRFSLAFSLSVWLVRCLGSQAVESLIIFLFIILAITALLVYSIQFRVFPRMHASAMGVTGFGQVAGVVSFIAINRKYNTLLFFSLICLFLTFGKTSIVLFLLLSIVYLIRTSSIVIVNLIYLLFVFLLFYLISFLVIKVINPDSGLFFSQQISPGYIFSLGGRTSIWEYALHLLQLGKIPLLGVGFNAASSLFAVENITYVEAGVIYYHQHFHSILIEYGFGLGITSIFIFFFILWRIWQTCHCKCHLSFMIFSFFLLHQSFDFTFYAPKDVIIWSLILGLAEGQWRFEYAE